MITPALEKLKIEDLQPQGLTSAQAVQQLKKDGVNELPKPLQRNFFRILLEIFQEPMFSLLLVGGVIYWLLGDTFEAVLLLLFASFSVSISVIQELRSERVLDALRDLASPRARFSRRGNPINFWYKRCLR
jgi:P-type Ca2+ transporter type 2C